MRPSINFKCHSYVKQGKSEYLKGVQIECFEIPAYSRNEVSCTLQACYDANLLHRTVKSGYSLGSFATNLDDQK